MKCGREERRGEERECEKATERGHVATINDGIVYRRTREL